MMMMMMMMMMMVMVMMISTYMLSTFDGYHFKSTFHNVIITQTNTNTSNQTTISGLLNSSTMYKILLKIRRLAQHVK